jgi:hypothetical protein
MTKASSLTVVTLPAHASFLGESIKVLVPAEWAERVKRLAPYVKYGPQFDRTIVEKLEDVSRIVRCDHNYDLTFADFKLHTAEAKVGLLQFVPWKEWK